MPLFQYRATDRAGRTQKGAILAPSGRDARRILRDGGLRPVSVKPSRGGASRLGDADTARLARQLATLLKAGFEIERALEAIAKSDDGGVIRPLALGVLEEIRAGQSFSEGLRKTRMTGEDVVLMIRAGEASGSLPEVLSGLADLYARRNALAARVKASLAYPAIVLLLSLGVVAFLLGYVLPMMSELFEETRTVLPLPTRIVLGLSAVFRYGSIPGLAAALAVLVRHRNRREDPAYRLGWERFRARLPLVGALELKTATVRFLRTIATLREGGVPLLEALSVAGAASGSVRIQEAARAAQRRVAEGESLASALSSSRLFSPMVIESVSLGESSGALPQVLSDLSEAWSEETGQQAEALAATLLPVLLIGVGILVAFVALAVLLPIFQFESTLAR